MFDFGRRTVDAKSNFAGCKRAYYSAQAHRGDPSKKRLTFDDVARQH